jgi:hypothetical protein
VTIRLAERREAMLARTVAGLERARLWELFVQRYPISAGYQHKTGRVIPVIVLTPDSRAVHQERMEVGRAAWPRSLMTSLASLLPVAGWPAMASG